jgi:tyrosyl-tRNA synthetase
LELKRIYESGELHPTDLKTAVAESLVQILEPVRDYFAKNKEAAKLKETVVNSKITR